MLGGYSLQVAQTAQSGATGSTSVPFVNNAELIFGSEGIDLSGGIQGGDASANPSQDSAHPLASSVADVSASGTSAIIWVSVAGILISLLLALKKPS